MRVTSTKGRALRLATILCAWLLLAAATAGGADINAPVADAAMRRDVAAVRRLLEQHADVNAAQGDGMTALHWAAEHGDATLAGVLLNAKASVRATTRIGNYTPLHIASRSGSGAVVKALLKAGADANAPTESGATALHFAAASGSVDAVNVLIDAKADVNAKETEWGQTPLVFAAAANRGDVIRVLLKRGADASIRTKSVILTEQTAQEQAATRKRNDVMTAMLPQAVRDSMRAAQVANIGAAGRGGPGGAGATGAAGGAGAAGAADAGAGAGAGGAGSQGGQGGQGGGGGRGAGAPPTDKLTAAQIQEAIAAGRELLRTAPTRPPTEEADTADGQVAGFAGNVGSIGGMTALHHAVRQGNVAAAVALVEGGADINATTSGDQTTPLLLATINGQFDVAMQLIKRGANVNLASLAGATPLYTAINTQWAPRSRFPQPQAVQNQKTTYLEIMDALLKAGTNPNVRLRTNLWYFAFNNCGNANCGLESLEGTTPFWRAAYAVDVDAMKMLVAAGADPTVPSERAPAGAGRGGRGGRGGAAGGRGGRGGAAGDTAQVAQAAGRGAPGRGGGGGGGGGGAGGPPLDPAIDSAAKAVPPGIGVYAIHSAAGVGYGNGFAGNSHRHAPDGWMPAMKYLVEELHADVNARDLNGYTPLHHAAARGDNEMILYLVSKGADPKAVARNGRTTVDMANGPVQRLRPIPETIALLEKMGAHNSHRCVGC